MKYLWAKDSWLYKAKKGDLVIVAQDEAGETVLERSIKSSLPNVLVKDLIRTGLVEEVSD